MEHTGFLFPRVLQFQITVTTTPCPHNTQTQMSACEHGEVSVSSVDCTDVSFLVLILHHSYARGNHRRRQWHPTPVPLPGKSHGWRSLVGCSDTTERLHFDFSLSCIGEGNGNSLQCSCLENLRDGGASWAAVYGVAQNRTRLKRLSSSSSSSSTR